MAKQKDKIFRFKQFEVSNSRSAMKVGTDGVLLGAWVDIDGVHRVLDVGTGTGLISLMLAQRVPDAEITAVEIDREAADEARINVARSPWPDSIDVVEGDVTALDLGEGMYDLIVSNPPYFKDALAAPDTSRNAARHEGTLTLESLMAVAARSLSAGGRIAVIVPSDREGDLDYAASLARLQLVRRCRVSTKPTGAPRRVLAEYAKGRIGACEYTELVIHQADGAGHSPEYAALTSPFYL